METAQKIEAIVKTIINLMVDGATVEVANEDGFYKIFIQAGEDAPSIIGRHGDTIRSLQKVIEVAAFKALGERVELSVNVNDYREKQVERLQSIAEEIVERVKSEQRAMPFRGLNSYERRIVHEYITKNHPEITSYSVGEGRSRELMIDLQSNSYASYNDDDAQTVQNQQ